MIDTHRYAAKLLFEFRVEIDDRVGERRTCEERIILLDAADARDALEKAKASGKEAEHVYENSDGNDVCFGFIGVMDLIELGMECESNEVWHESKIRLRPSERQSDLIPSECDLRAIAHEKRNKRTHHN